MRERWKKLGGKERERKGGKTLFLTVSSEKVHSDIMVDYRDKRAIHFF